jgi:hypothetical protein
MAAAAYKPEGRTTGELIGGKTFALKLDKGSPL